MDERVVLAPDEMQRAAIEPGDDQRAVLGERVVDVSRGDALGASPDRKPKPARVLALDGEDPLGNGHGIARGLAAQQLRTEASLKQGLGAFPGHMPR